jgi:aminoglycoside phosphotransferase (APT) family kinase protein
MGFVDGQVPIEAPMYTTEGFFTELAPERRRTMLLAGVEAMADVHRLDWRAADLGWLVSPEAGGAPSTHQQLDIWQAYGERELGDRRHPDWERALAWLRAEVPEGSPPALCWGDPRPGNVIWRDDHPACLTDFEAACIAPPELDLGWWLMSDRWAHEVTGVERLPGEPSRAAQAAAYEVALGREVGPTAWWEVFAATRYTAIVVRVMNRMVDRGHLPADHTIWLENPAASCLAQLLEEVGA